MFYEESLINSLLICSVCECKFEDPRVLPCGKTFCFKCVEFLTSMDRNEIKCRNCGKMHVIPHDGFPANQELAKLVEIKPNEVTRNSGLATILKAKTHSLSERAKCLETDMLLCETNIKDTCDKTRNNVQLAIEEAHVKLDTFHAEFMQEISDYEKKCMTNISTISQNKAKLDELLSQSNEFYARSSQMLKQYILEYKSIKASINEANQLLSMLDNASYTLECDIFDNRIMKFEKNSLRAYLSSEFKNRNL